MVRDVPEWRDETEDDSLKLFGGLLGEEAPSLLSPPIPRRVTAADELLDREVAPAAEPHDPLVAQPGQASTSSSELSDPPADLDTNGAAPVEDEAPAPATLPQTPVRQDSGSAELPSTSVAESQRKARPIKKPVSRRKTRARPATPEAQPQAPEDGDEDDDGDDESAEAPSEDPDDDAAASDSGDDEPLFFTSAEQSRGHLHRRVKLTIRNDDVDRVKDNAETYVRRILAAIKLPTCAKAEKKSSGAELTAGEIDTWLRWQTDAYETVTAILGMDEEARAIGADVNIAAEIEAHAWQLLQAIINVHEVGYCLTNLNLDTTSKCSERVETAIQMMEKYFWIRHDVLEDINIDLFASTPKAYATRKVANFWVNAKKGSQLKAGKKTPAKPKVKKDGQAGDDEEDKKADATPNRRKKVDQSGFETAAYKRRFSKEEIAKLKANARAREAGEPLPYDVGNALSYYDDDVSDGGMEAYEDADAYEGYPSDDEVEEVEDDSESEIEQVPPARYPRRDRAPTRKAADADESGEAESDGDGDEDDESVDTRLTRSAPPKGRPQRRAGRR